MTTLIIATRNAHKVEEIRGVLGTQFQFLTLRDFPNAPAVVEDANTFAGNATKKAVELACWVAVQGSTFKVQGSVFVLADDSGLEVDALNGAPGVHSARFAALDSVGTRSTASQTENSPDTDNNAKLLRLLQNVPAEQRTARFRCVIALTPLFAPQNTGASPACTANEHELSTELFDGACEGRITFTPSGAKGFGYDPLFVPNGSDQSFAKLGEEVKNRISHRAKALEKLRTRFATAQ
jgi:XTP/dITP diphosphohydrolase